MTLLHGGQSTNMALASFFLAVSLSISIILSCRITYGLLLLLTAHVNRTTGKTDLRAPRAANGYGARRIKCHVIYFTDVNWNTWAKPITRGLLFPGLHHFPSLYCFKKYVSNIIRFFLCIGFCLVYIKIEIPLALIRVPGGGPGRQ